MDSEPTSLALAVAGAKITSHRTLNSLKPPVAEPQLHQLQDAILPKAAPAAATRIGADMSDSEMADVPTSIVEVLETAETPMPRAFQSPNTIPEATLAESVPHDDSNPGSDPQKETASPVAEAKTANLETSLENEVESILAKQYLSLSLTLQRGLLEN